MVTRTNKTVDEEYLSLITCKSRYVVRQFAYFVKRIHDYDLILQKIKNTGMLGGLRILHQFQILI